MGLAPGSLTPLQSNGVQSCHCRSAARQPDSSCISGHLHKVSPAGGFRRAGLLTWWHGAPKLVERERDRERACTKRKLCHLLGLGLGNHTALCLWNSACPGSCRGLPRLRGENTDSTSDRGVTKFWKSRQWLWLFLENTWPRGYCGFSVTPPGCGARGPSDFPLGDSVSSAVKWGC